MVTVYPIETTLYNPEMCYNGYTLLCFPANPRPVQLIDMNGNVVNEWRLQAARARLLENGNIIMVLPPQAFFDEAQAKVSKTSDLDITKASNRIQEYSWEHELIWEYVPPGNAHHDVQRLDNGNTLLLYMEVVPEEYKKKIENLKRRRDVCVYSDVVLELTPDKEIVWEWHEYKYLDINQYCQICNLADWTHTNTVQALPENKWYDAGDKRFKPGNILLSLRNLSVIFVVDKESKEVVWTYTGDYNGGLAGQHEPHMIEKGLPGEGNILIFDNGAPSLKNLRHSGQSYVLEINPVSKNLVWRYENGEKFFSKARSNMQRLPNGNTLICESEGPRIFEVTSEKEIVWEYAVPYQLIIGRAYRYPYDYCPQLRALDKPKEEMVSSPSHVSTKPIALGI